MGEGVWTPTDHPPMERSEAIILLMSPGARIAIVLDALLCALGFAATAYTAPEAFPNPNALYGCALFCLLVAVACASGPVGAVVRRTIVALVCVAYLGYVVKEVAAPAPMLLSGSRAKPSVLNAVAGLVLIGLPCGLYAVSGDKLVRKLKPS